MEVQTHTDPAYGYTVRLRGTSFDGARDSDCMRRG